MTTFKVSAQAPTSYQLNSLRHFGLGCNPRGNGSYYGEQYFYSQEEAKAYLTRIAEDYFENESDLQEALQDINMDALTIDAVTARIEEEEFYTICLCYGNREEFWAGQNGRLTNSEFDALKFYAKEDANEALDSIVKPYAQEQGWENVTFKIV